MPRVVRLRRLVDGRDHRLAADGHRLARAAQRHLQQDLERPGTAVQPAAQPKFGAVEIVVGAEGVANVEAGVLQRAGLSNVQDLADIQHVVEVVVAKAAEQFQAAEAPRRLAVGRAAEVDQVIAHQAADRLKAIVDVDRDGPFDKIGIGHQDARLLPRLDVVERPGEDRIARRRAAERAVVVAQGEVVDLEAPGLAGVEPHTKRRCAGPSGRCATPGRRRRARWRRAARRPARGPFPAGWW